MCHLSSSFKPEILWYAESGGFECAEPLDVFTALRNITGASGQLPRLPPCLESLSWAVSIHSRSPSAEYEALQVKIS